MKHRYFEVLYGNSKEEPFSAGVRVLSTAIKDMQIDNINEYVMKHLPLSIRALEMIVFSVSEVPQNRCFYDRVNDELFVFRTIQAATICRENVLQKNSSFVPHRQRRA